VTFLTAGLIAGLRLRLRGVHPSEHVGSDDVCLKIPAVAPNRQHSYE
jgi:hypothetical protein